MKFGLWFAFLGSALAGRVVLLPFVTLLLALETDFTAKAQAQTPGPSSALVPKLSASPASGPVGTVINLKGSDFPPDISLNIAIGRVNSEAGGSFATPVTGSSGTFETHITLQAPPGQQSIPPGEIILVAHNSDYSVKALASFQVVASPAAPGSMPGTGLGFKTDHKLVILGLPLPNLVALAALLILAGASFIALIKLRRKYRV